jgi:hypothetical protein
MTTKKQVILYYPKVEDYNYAADVLSNLEVKFRSTFNKYICISQKNFRLYPNIDQVTQASACYSSLV